MNTLDIEQRLDQFEEAWQRSPPPTIEDFLPPTAASAAALVDPRCRELLKELIKIDMDYRWRQSSPVPSGARQVLGPPRLEDYCRRYPSLRGVEALFTELIGEEYRGRHRLGDHASHAEYARRFPGQWAHLQVLLARIDGELAAERIREGKRPSSQPPASLLVHPLPSAVMGPPQTIGELLETFEQCRLLSRVQWNDPVMSDLQRRCADPRTLARELMQRGWLTPYQLNQVFLGRGRELLLGQYLLMERVGDGGMGQVFKARHQDMKRTVAVKVIRKDLLGDPETANRFRREVELISQLTHPHVAHAYDASLTGPICYLVMEYVEGISLAKLVQTNGPLAVEQACDYIRQAALGLQHIHERGLVHRDIKPLNLIVESRELSAENRTSRTGRAALDARPAGLVKILDLGLARLRHLADRGAAGGDTTAGQTVMGTLDYMAPEQALDFHQADIRADIYSLGCAFYFLLTGQPPFPADTNAKKMLLHQLQEPPPLERARRHVPPEVQAVVQKMLAKRPEDRFQTPDEVAQALAPFIPGAAPPSAALVPVKASPANLLPVALPHPQQTPVSRSVVVVDIVPSRTVRAVERLRDWLQRRPRSQRRRIILAAGIGTLLTLVVSVWFLVGFFWDKPEEVFLSDLEQVDVQGGAFGNQGFLQRDKTFAVVNSRRSAKGLIVRTNGDGLITQVTYHLGKRYRRLQTVVALNDPTVGNPKGSFRFSIIGDGKVLWESQPIRVSPSEPRDSQQCDISVAGVDVLQLGVISQGLGGMGGPVVWVDPKLTR